MDIILYAIAIILTVTSGIYTYRLHKFFSSFSETVPSTGNDKFVFENLVQLRTSVHGIYSTSGVLIFVLAFLGLNSQHSITQRATEEILKAPEVRFALDSVRFAKDSSITLLNTFLTSVQSVRNIETTLPSLKGRVFISGATQRGKTEWAQYNDNGLTCYVSTKAHNFSQTPQYFTALGGTVGHWQTSGVTSIYDPTPEGFRVYLYNPTDKITPDIANTNGWHVQWIAVP